jgi:hypothetical protein
MNALLETGQPKDPEIENATEVEEYQRIELEGERAGYSNSILISPLSFSAYGL